MARVLIIDDHDDTRAAYRLTLEMAGFEVDDAPNGVAGLEAFRRHPASVVICDLFMPEKDGIETIMALRKEYPLVRIIAVSASARMGRVNLLEVAQRLGASQIFEKPVEPQLIVAGVRKALEDL